MSEYFQQYHKYVAAISESGISIYDPIEPGTPELWIPASALEVLLNQGLKGMSVHGLPIRTRSKVVKQAICRVLGYPTPRTFKKTHPRFPGQRFDTYIQKSNNLQIWNEEIALTRRYVIIRVSPDDIIERVKVITGESLAALDTTGTITKKYQAYIVPKQESTELVATEDTSNLKPIVRGSGCPIPFEQSPVDNSAAETLLPITVIFDRLKSLVGCTFADSGYDQERNRGAELHRLVCSRLGYKEYRDAGTFPDVRNQLLEVKLQTSPTIDLGLVCPDSQEPLDIPKINSNQIRFCDVRYAVFYAQTDGEQVELTHFYLTTGEAFFSWFPQFQGRVVNKKLQIVLPGDFFN
ncbi:restriction endonuclease [bacterium]|nr:restriction endonuclease [bacterium]